MFFMTLTLLISFLSVGTFSILWKFREQINDFIDNVSDNDDDDDDENDAPIPLRDVSSHDSMDSNELYDPYEPYQYQSITYFPFPFRFEFKHQDCSKRVKTPIAFKQELEGEIDSELFKEKND
jgi:hypothetical protein